MMTLFLQEKVAGIAGKYVDLVEKQIDDALQSKDVSKMGLAEINEGIRMIHHVTAALWKLSACGQEHTVIQKDCLVER